MGLRMLPNADAYIFEGPTAGGHNAPARSKSLNSKGEPDYGALDAMDFAYMKMWFDKDAQKNGAMKPHWLAGGYGSPEGLLKAKEHGATGVQIGSVAGYGKGSGIYDPLRLLILKQMMDGGTVFTSPDFSSSGYPFKLFQSLDTLENPALYNVRKRICDLGFLVDLYKTPEGKIGTRCPSENVANYIKKGGSEKDTINKGCLCNGLPVNVGLGSPGELPVITCGSDLSSIKIMVNKYGPNYTVKNVIDYILDK
jgi:NAD(P)H-dependent flavin oxidoreductase YrpB (nitropropane dioxygenase family)